MFKLMLKKLTLLAVVVIVAAAGLMGSPQASASPGNLGAGYYFASFCGYVGPAASRCFFGPVIWFGPFTSQAQCNATVQQMIATQSVLVTSPYAPSNCFYFAS